MTIKEFLKRAFIPWYWFSGISSKDKDREGEFIAAIFYGLILTFWIIVRLSQGISDANKKDGCIIKSIGEALISPAYTIGCNLGKDRFKVRVN